MSLLCCPRNSEIKHRSTAVPRSRPQLSLRGAFGELFPTMQGGRSGECVAAVPCADHRVAAGPNCSSFLRPRYTETGREFSPWLASSSRQRLRKTLALMARGKVPPSTSVAARSEPETWQHQGVKADPHRIVFEAFAMYASWERGGTKRGSVACPRSWIGLLACSRKKAS